MHVKLISDHKKLATFPPIYIPVLSTIGMCAITCSLYLFYPVALGKLAGELLGWEPLPFFFATHANFYTLIQDVLRGFYTLTTIGLLNLSLFFFIYIMLDECITRQRNRLGLLLLSIRAVKPFLLFQFIIILIGTLSCWKINSFTAISWLPSFATASAKKAAYTAAWELACVIFACSFALTEYWKNALRKAWDLLVSYPLFWFLFTALLWGTAFSPAWSLNRLGVTITAWYIILGIGVQFMGLTIGLLLLFHQSGEFEAE